MTSCENVNFDKSRLEYLVSIINNPTIIFVGRCKRGLNTLTSIFDDVEYIEHIGIKVINIDISEKKLPDIVCDFNKYKDRESLSKYITNNYGNVVMIIFDVSVFKFMTDLKTMFAHIKKMLIPEGVFITEYNVFGGCIAISNDLSSAQIYNLNNIVIPMKECIHMKAIDAIGISKSKIIKQSQELVRKELTQYFDVSFVIDEPYPYMSEYVTTYYVCTNVK